MYILQGSNVFLTCFELGITDTQLPICLRVQPYYFKSFQDLSATQILFLTQSEGLFFYWEYFIQLDILLLKLICLLLLCIQHSQDFVHLLSLPDFLQQCFKNFFQEKHTHNFIQNFKGFLVSTRNSVYNWTDLVQKLRTMDTYGSVDPSLQISVLDVTFTF